MTTQEKRAVLASWASNANAVPHIPACVGCPDGSIVNVGEILRAISLDGSDTNTACEGGTVLPTQPFIRRRVGLRTWSGYRLGDDDDDPPPVRPTQPSGRGRGVAQRSPVRNQCPHELCGAVAA